MPDDVMPDDGGAPDTPDDLTSEITAAKARIAELEAAATDIAPIVEIGRKQHRAQMRAQILGVNGKLVDGAGDAFELIVETTAAKLGINIDRPLALDDQKRLVAAVHPLARALLKPHSAGAPPSTSTEPTTPPRKRGL